MMAVVCTIFLLPLSMASCTWKKHANTIGPKNEQKKRVDITCTTAASCVAKASKSCEAAPDCNSFGISPIWHNGLEAQLYSTHWNASYPNTDWTLYACSEDEPPALPPTPAPPAPPPAPPGQCKTNFDCSLNGVCDTATGNCRCDAPWKNGASGKESCNVLDVLPHSNSYVPAYGGPRVNTAYGPQNTTSWGGNIIRGDDGQYHLWVSAMGGGQGLNSWGHNSQIDHAVASDPMDVFRKVDTTLQKEAHNASPLRAHNGSYLLFHIGDAGVKGGSHFLHHSESPSGPWLPLPSLHCNNPAPMLHVNGTVYCGCNSGG